MYTAPSLALHTHIFSINCYLYFAWYVRGWSKLPLKNLGIQNSLVPPICPNYEIGGIGTQRLRRPPKKVQNRYPLI